MITTSLYRFGAYGTPQEEVVFWLGGKSWGTTREEFLRFIESVLIAKYGEPVISDHWSYVHEGNTPIVRGVELRFGGHKVELDFHQLSQLCELLLRYKYGGQTVEWDNSGLYTREEESKANENFWRWKLLGIPAI